MRSVIPKPAAAAPPVPGSPTPAAAAALGAAHAPQPGAPAGLAAPNAPGVAGPPPATADQSLTGGKNWLKGLNPGQLTRQLPQLARACAAKFADGMRGLSTTQKVAGGAALALALGWLATRARRAPATATHHSDRFDDQPFGGRGKPRYAGGAVQPGYGRSGRY